MAFPSLCACLTATHTHKPTSLYHLLEVSPCSLLPLPPQYPFRVTTSFFSACLHSSPLLKSLYLVLSQHICCFSLGSSWTLLLFRSVFCPCSEVSTTRLYYPTPSDSLQPAAAAANGHSPSLLSVCLVMGLLAGVKITDNTNLICLSSALTCFHHSPKRLSCTPVAFRPSGSSACRAQHHIQPSISSICHVI